MHGHLHLFTGIEEQRSLATLRSEPAVDDPRPEAIWSDLTEGRARVSAWTSNEACTVMRIERLGVRAEALDSRSLQVLERLLLGVSQKVCAAEFGLSTSSVTTIARRSLTTLGIQCLPSRVPLLVVVLAWAASVREQFPMPIVSVSNSGELMMPNACLLPSTVFASALSRAELIVAALLAQGYSYAEIAQRRGTSVRTVANQIGTVFHRMGVSGRVQLLAAIARSLSATPCAVTH
jgi:DNA-binding CsgD family transcriptional regulator